MRFGFDTNIRVNLLPMYIIIDIFYSFFEEIHVILFGATVCKNYYWINKSEKNLFVWQRIGHKTFSV